MNRHDFSDHTATCYSEWITETHLEVSSRIEKVSRVTDGGQWVENDAQGMESTYFDSEPKSGRIDQPSPGAIGERIATLTQWMRQTFPETDKQTIASLNYRERIRHFRPGSAFDIMSEETADLEIHWRAAQTPGKSGQLASVAKNGYLALRRNSIPALIEDFKRTAPTRTQIQDSLKAAEPWPAPAGEIPLFFSAKAFSKLCVPFALAFEADRILAGKSFLSRLENDLPIRFCLRNRGTAMGDFFDCEGTRRADTILWDQGRAQTVASNRATAARLKIESSGHGRNTSYRFPRSVGLSSVEVKGDHPQKALLSTIPWGIFVEDVEMLAYEPRSTQAELVLSKARLIHAGTPGETIAPITLPISLLSFLPTFQTFSEDGETFGYPIKKDGQSWILEVTCPAAFSAPIPIEGTVPTSHYW